MEGNPFSIDMNVNNFLGMKMFKRFVEFSFLKNAINNIPLPHSSLEVFLIDIYPLIVLNYYSLTP